MRGMLRKNNFAAGVRQPRSVIKRGGYPLYSILPVAMARFTSPMALVT